MILLRMRTPLAQAWYLVVACSVLSCCQVLLRDDWIDGGKERMLQEEVAGIAPPPHEEISGQERNQPIIDDLVRQHHPRTVFLGDDTRPKAKRKRKLDRSPSSSVRKATNNFFKPLPIDQSMCEPQQQVLTAQPTCNSFHEMDLTLSLIGSNLSLLGSGGWRVAFLYDDTVVLKLLQNQKDFDAHTFQRHATDAIVSSALTSGNAPIVSTHGYCGQSIVTQRADTTLRRELTNTTDISVRVHYARSVAAAIAALHQVDLHGIARFAHHDLKPDNIVLVNGTIKLNDFNDAEVLLYNTTDQRECRFRRPRWSVYYKSPEDVLELPLSHKIDIYSLGGILYHLVTGHQPHHDLNKEAAMQQVARGQIPQVSKRLLRTKDKRIQTMLNLTLQCWSYQPDNRPSALYVQQELSRILDDEEEVA